MFYGRRITMLYHMATETVDPKRPEFRNVPLRMPADLDDLIERAKEKTGLAKQDVMRLSLDRGIDILVEQLTGKPLREQEAVAA